MKNTTRALAAAALGFSLVLSACGGAEVTDETPVDQAPQQTEDTPQAEDTAQEQTPQDTDASVAGDTNVQSAITAIATAESENSGIAVQIDWEDGDHWEVEVVEGDREIEYRISADGTEILGSQDDDDSDDDDRRAADAAEISLSEAIEAVAAEHSGDLEQAELDDDDNRVGYEIEMREGGDDVEFWVDAISGDVTREG